MHSSYRDTNLFGATMNTGFRNARQLSAIGSLLLCATLLFPLLTALADTPTPLRIHVDGKTQHAKLTHEVRAKYPPEARAAGIEGVVHLEIIVATDGSIKQLQVLSGHPLLVKAALDAVRQWTYVPTTLNGQPVEVVTRVAVVFKLPQ
jgi:TonB family protein